MDGSKTLKALLVLVSFLLALNLARPLLEPGVAYADKEPPAQQPTAISGSGATAWVLQGNKVYYLQFQTNYESIRIYGPEELK